ncbi:MAG: TonB family protein [Maribacter sp.]|jgi:TonB family protein
MILPWIKIEALKTTVPEQYYVYPEFLWNVNSPAVVTTGTASPVFQISWQEGVLYGGMLLAAFLFGYKLYQLQQLRAQGTIAYFPNFTRVVVKNSELAFSFFKSIFLGDKVLSREHKSIIQHELVHIKQRHSLDLVFFELMRILAWFNPLVYVYQHRISELHEFIADVHVPKTERTAHYDLLLSKVFQSQNISFVNQFYKKSLIKKRIIMLQKSKSKRIFQLKYLLFIPLVFGMLCYSSCELRSDDKNSLHESFVVADLENIGIEKSSELFTQLIDLSVQSRDWSMVVRDQHSTVTFTKAPKGFGISGPGGAMINAKMHIESKVLSEDFELFEVDFSKQTQIVVQNGAIPFKAVEEIPIFPGCEDVEDKRTCFNEMMHKHISDNFSYPKEAMKKGIQGRVNIIFTIGKDGVVQNLKMRGPDVLLENEAKRIIDLLPNIMPGKQKGIEVDVPYSIPISFRLNSEPSNENEEVNYDNATQVPFEAVEEIPIFPGCESESDKRACFNEKIQKHISENFNYPQAAQDAGIQGRVNVMFIIQEDGSIGNMKLRGPDKLLEDEVERIINRLPTMTPGKQKGTVVAVPFSIPVTFKLQ